MRTLLALIPIGAFGFAGYAIAFRAIPPGSLVGSVDNAIRFIGPGLTGALLMSFGILLSWLISRRGGKSDG